MPMMPKQAMVLSGGGAFGAYEVGVMKALALGRPPGTEHRSFDPSIYTGTSVGAYNAVFLAAQVGVPCAEALARLEQVWLEIIADQGDGNGNGVFRYRANPFQLFNPFVVLRHPGRTLAHFVEDTVHLSLEALRRFGWFVEETDETVPNRLATIFDLPTFISLDPLEETLEETIDYRRLRDSEKSVWIAATNWSTGDLELVGTNDMTEKWGPHLLKGSASIPGIFPPEWVGGDWLVDGSVVMNTPLGPALKEEADVIHVITLHPRDLHNSLRSLESTIGAMSRAQHFAWDYIVRTSIRDLGVAYEIFRDMQQVAGRAGRKLGGDRRGAPLSWSEKMAEKVMAELGLNRNRLADIHRYRPAEHLQHGPLGIMFFERELVEEVIERGFTDTCRHDCEKQGCLLAGGPR